MEEGMDTEANGFWSDGCLCYGPVSESRVQDAENILQVKFPPSYRKFLLHFGAVHEVAGLPGPLPPGEVRPWSDEVSHSSWNNVVEISRSMQTAPYGNECNRQFLYLMSDGGDAWYCLDSSQMDQDGEYPVVMFGPEHDPPVVVAKNFFEFLRPSYRVD